MNQIIHLIIVLSIVEMEATVDKKEITVGDPIKYQVELKLGEGVEIELPQIDKMGNFEVLDKQETKKGELLTIVYTITAFKAGQDTIPEVPIKCIDVNGDTIEVTTSSIAINIKSVLPTNLQDIKDIKSPVSIPRNVLLLIIGIILICVIGGVLYFYYRKRLAKRSTQVLLTKPPHEIAYERLEVLKLEDGKIKEYYIEISDIIRRYIEGRYEISAPTQTTFELYREMRRVKVELRTIELIRNFLNNCDIVKFAKYIPPIETIEEDVDAARNIIDRTKPYIEGS